MCLKQGTLKRLQQKGATHVLVAIKVGFCLNWAEVGDQGFTRVVAVCNLPSNKGGLEPIHANSLVPISNKSAKLAEERYRSQRCSWMDDWPPPKHGHSICNHTQPSSRWLLLNDHEGDALRMGWEAASVVYATSPPSQAGTASRL